jgi:hypothetical protein
MGSPPWEAFVKKVLIGLGIGCGSLIVLGIIAVMAGGFWLKGKAEEFTGDLQAVAKKAEAQQTKISALNQKYAFKAPPKGNPLRLEERRVQEYLAVRAALQPVWKTYEQKSEDLNKTAGDKPGVGDAFRAMGLLANLVGDLRDTWLTQLESRKMSPGEYHAITAALYSSNWGAAINDMRKGQQEMFAQAKEGLQRQLDTTTDEDMRAMLEEQVRSMDQQLAAMPASDGLSADAEALHKANKALYDKYKSQIEEHAAQGLDFLLLGDGENNLGTAFEQIDFGMGR